MIKSLLYKEETDRKYFCAKVDLARSLFDKRHDFNGTLLEVNNIQESFYLGCQAINYALSQSAQMSTSSRNKHQDRRLLIFILSD